MVHQIVVRCAPLHGAPLLCILVGQTLVKHSGGTLLTRCATANLPSSGTPLFGAPRLCSSGAQIKWCATGSILRLGLSLVVQTWTRWWLPRLAVKGGMRGGHASTSLLRARERCQQGRRMEAEEERWHTVGESGRSGGARPKGAAELRRVFMRRGV
jgi:hypothetical protein